MKVWKTKIQQKERQVLIVFDNMIADTGSSKKLKLKMSVVFVSQTYYLKLQSKCVTTFYHENI